MAAAGARFALKIVEGLQGPTGVTENAYVEGGSKYGQFFAQRVLFGKNGWEKTIDFGKVSAYEQQLIDGAVETLKKNIDKGIEFGKQWAADNQ